jgi:hypothetical protein
MALLSHSHGAQPQDGTSGQWITVEIDAMVSIAASRAAVRISVAFRLCKYRVDCSTFSEYQCGCD